MEIALLLVAAGTLAFVLAPLFRRKAPPAGPGDRSQEEARDLRKAIEQEDLELEYAAGKLTREDFERERSRIERS